MKEIQYYPMTTAEDLLLFADRFCFIPSWLNIASVIDIQEPINEQRMLQSIFLTMMRIPSANLRLHKKDKKTYEQYFSDELPKGIELIDMSDLSDAEVEAKLTKWAQTPFPNKRVDTQLYNIKLLRRKGGKNSIFICVYHMAFDSYALMMTVRYIFKVYEALTNNTALPKEYGSPIPMYEADYAYCATENYQKDLEYWEGVWKKGGQPKFTSLHGNNPKYYTKDGHAGKRKLFQNKTLHENLRIPAEIVKKVAAKAEEWHISPQTFYQLALQTYLSVLCETDDVMTCNAVARRAKRIQKTGGGTMVNPVLIRTNIDKKNVSFRDSCEVVYRTLTDAYRHVNVAFGAVSAMQTSIYHASPADTYSGINFCFQPYFNMANDDLNITFHRLNNGGGNSVLYLTIMACDTTGDLIGNYEYITPYYTADQMHKLHDFILKFVENGVSNPEEMLESVALKSM